MKYPKGFFTGREGEENAKVCLRHALSEGMALKTIPEIYQMFSTDGVRFLRSKMLNTAYVENWKDPLDYLHASLAPSQKDELLYRKLKGEKLASSIGWNLRRINDNLNSLKDIVESSMLFRYYRIALAQEDNERKKNLLAVLFTGTDWKKRATACLIGALGTEPAFEGMDKFDIMDYISTPEGERYLKKIGFAIPLAKLGDPITLFETTLLPLEIEANKETLIYARKKYYRQRKE